MAARFPRSVLVELRDTGGCSMEDEIRSDHPDAADERSADVERILSNVLALRRSSSTVFVAIDGPGGSGKTFLADALSCAMPRAGLRSATIHTDDFFLPSARRASGEPSEKPVGSDVDWVRLRDEVLTPLRRGEPARYGRYDWDRDAILDRRVAVADDVIVVEGVYSSRKELAALYDLRIWVDCARELRLARGVARDGEAARRRWEEDWMPSEDRYMAAHRPREQAHLLFDGAKETS